MGNYFVQEKGGFIIPEFGIKYNAEDYFPNKYVPNLRLNVIWKINNLILQTNMTLKELKGKYYQLLIMLSKV